MLILIIAAQRSVRREGTVIEVGTNIGLIGVVNGYFHTFGVRELPLKKLILLLLKKVLLYFSLLKHTLDYFPSLR